MVGALACYEAALQLNPADWCAHNNLGVVFKEQGECDRARQCYEAAIQHGPPDW